MSITMQISLIWIAVAMYVLASIAFTWQTVAKTLSQNTPQDTTILTYVSSDKAHTKLDWGIRFTLLGLLPHTVALAMRWVDSGHGPYMRVFEVYLSDVWVALVIFLLALSRWRWLKICGIVVLPASLLLIGFAIMASPEIKPLPETFGTFWLIVHIAFAKLAFGANLIGTALAVMVLIGGKHQDNAKRLRVFVSLPPPNVLHDYSYRFIMFGFVMFAIMIASGAIWANKAWGSYWSWDPVETWSLISWLLYGIYLHLVKTRGWKGRPPAWLAVGAVGVMAFAIFGLGLVYQSLHSPYIR